MVKSSSCPGTILCLCRTGRDLLLGGSILSGLSASTLIVRTLVTPMRRFMALIRRAIDDVVLILAHYGEPFRGEQPNKTVMQAECDGGAIWHQLVDRVVHAAELRH